MGKKEKQKKTSFRQINEQLDAAYSAMLDIVVAANNIFEDKNEEIRRLKQEAKKIADKELLAENEALKKQLSMSYGHFDSEKELKAYKAFCKKHEKCRLSLKANGGKMPYVEENGTGVGACKTVVCPICGKEKDITDISVW